MRICETRRECSIGETPSVCVALQRAGKLRRRSFLNYKSAALNQLSYAGVPHTKAVFSELIKSRDVSASQLRSLNTSTRSSKFSCIVEISPLSVTSKFAISNTRAPSSPPGRVPGNCTNTRLELEFKITEAISNNGENSSMLISHGTVTKTVARAGWDGVSWPGAASKLGTTCNPAGANERE